MLGFVKGIKVTNDIGELLKTVFQGETVKVVDPAGEVFDGRIEKLTAKEMQLKVEGESGSRVFTIDSISLRFEDEE